MTQMILIVAAVAALAYGSVHAARAVRRQVRHWRVARMLHAIHRQAYQERPE